MKPTEALHLKIGLQGSAPDVSHFTENITTVAFFMIAGQSLAAAGDLGQIFVWKPAGPTLKTASKWRPTNCG